MHSTSNAGRKQKQTERDGAAEGIPYGLLGRLLADYSEIPRIVTGTSVERM